MDKEEAKSLHESVLNLLFANVLTNSQANKLHAKIDKKVKSNS